MDVPRTLAEPGTRPYYFTFSAILGSGVRIPQYDDRGRVWQLSRTPDAAFEDVVGVEVFVHPAFAVGAPSARVNLPGRFEVAYVGARSLPIGGGEAVDYWKQRIEVTWPGGWLLAGTPDDFASAGAEPAPGWRFDVVVSCETVSALGGEDPPSGSQPRED